MAFWARNPINPTKVYQTNYTKITNFTGPYAGVVRSYSMVDDVAQEQGSGVLIAPGFVLSAWHVYNDYPIGSKTIERGSTTVGIAAESRSASTATFLREGNFLTNDLALVKVSGDFNISASSLAGLYVTNGASQHSNPLLQNAYTVGHAGLVEAETRELALTAGDASQTAYRLNVDASQKFGQTGNSPGVPGTWTDPSAIGAGGHSGGPLSTSW